MHSQFFTRVFRVWVLLAATALLPILAYAGTDNGKGNNGQNNGQQNGHHNIPVVPEANTVWVLIPVVGAVLLVSRRQFSRAKESR